MKMSYNLLSLHGYRHLYGVEACGGGWVDLGKYPICYRIKPEFGELLQLIILQQSNKDK